MHKPGGLGHLFCARFDCNCSIANPSPVMPPILNQVLREPLKPKSKAEAPCGWHARRTTDIEQG